MFVQYGFLYLIMTKHKLTVHPKRHQNVWDSLLNFVPFYRAKGASLYKEATVLTDMFNPRTFCVLAI